MLSVKQNGNRTGKRKLHSANWPPGRSGNPKGRPKNGHTFRDLLNERLDKEAFVQRVIELAMEGNSTALREVLERIDGKVPQALIGEGEAPLVRAITVNFVKSENQDS